jgi:hypothetical protein
VSLVAITLCVASQRVFVVVAHVYFVMTQSGNFWIHPRISFVHEPWVIISEEAWGTRHAAKYTAND